MQMIAEISLYPFTAEYDGPIETFIRKLQSYDGLEVRTTETSTIIRGEYDRLFPMLQTECKKLFADDHRAAIVIKLLNTK